MRRSMSPDRISQTAFERLPAASQTTTLIRIDQRSSKNVCLDFIAFGILEMSVSYVERHGIIAGGTCPLLAIVRPVDVKAKTNLVLKDNLSNEEQGIS